MLDFPPIIRSCVNLELIKSRKKERKVREPYMEINARNMKGLMSRSSSAGCRSSSFNMRKTSKVSISSPKVLIKIFDGLTANPRD